MCTWNLSTVTEAPIRLASAAAKAATQLEACRQAQVRDELDPDFGETLATGWALRP